MFRVMCGDDPLRGVRGKAWDGVSMYGGKYPPCAPYPPCDPSNSMILLYYLLFYAVLSSSLQFSYPPYPP